MINKRSLETPIQPQTFNVLAHQDGSRQRDNNGIIAEPFIHAFHRRRDSFIAWEEDTPHFSAISSASEWFDSKEQEDCPTCSEKIDMSQSSLHSHVSQCFLSNRVPPHLEAIYEHDLKTSHTQRNMEQVKQTIDQMDLRTRLELMESFYRLSKSQEVGESGLNQGSTAVSPKAYQSDSCALKLLYGSQSENNIDQSFGQVGNSMERRRRNSYVQGLESDIGFEITETEHDGLMHHLFVPFNNQGFENNAMMGNANDTSPLKANPRVDFLAKRNVSS